MDMEDDNWSSDGDSSSSTLDSPRPQYSGIASFRSVGDEVSAQNRSDIEEEPDDMEVEAGEPQASQYIAAAIATPSRPQYSGIAAFHGIVNGSDETDEDITPILTSPLSLFEDSTSQLTHSEKQDDDVSIDSL